MKGLAVVLSLLGAPASAQFLRGINLAGAEFGENILPGRLGSEYTWNSEASYAYFAGKGLNLIRVPFRWERMQPLPRGPLDAEYLAGLKQNVAWAKKYGVRVVIEPHNFGRYYGAVLSPLDLLDFWERLSDEFREDQAVYAYDLMNEPYRMGQANWKLISQTVLSAIRNRGDNKRIMVPGDEWSSANRWTRVHGTQGWIVDPADNFAYEAHQYFDPDESGRYDQGYTAADPDYGRRLVAGFIEWCRNNGARGFLGEYGVPNSDPRWLPVLDRFLGALDEAGMDGAYWAAGEWWGDYPLSVQPRGGADRAQLGTLEVHRGAAVMTSVSAATGEAVAPDSLVSGYGLNLRSGVVEVKDASGVVHTASVLYASPLQMNYVLPAGTAPGVAEVVVRSDGRATAWGTVRVQAMAPGLFTGYEVVRSGERRFLILYATGVRAGGAFSVRVSDLVLLPGYAGPQMQYQGLDQVNVELPEAIAGEAAVTVVVDGHTSNEIRVNLPA